MESIQNLIDVLTSQYNLYQELLSLLKQEKKYISEWNIDKTLDITKSKDTLLYKEKILDEARVKILKRMSKDFDHDLTLNELMAKLDSADVINELKVLQSKINNITSLIQAENISIKILYKTNMKMISDVFEKLGVTENTGYQIQGKANKKHSSSFVRSA